MQRLIAMALALWAGSLLTVCAIAAPAAFAVLDRRGAGQLAGRLFLIEMVVGVVVAACFLVAFTTGRVTATRAVAVLVAIAAAAPLASEVALSPLMQAARDAGDMARFGALHGVSALLFVVACVCSLIAAWLFSRPAA